MIRVQWAIVVHSIITGGIRLRPVIAEDGYPELTTEEQDKQDQA